MRGKEFKSFIDGLRIEDHPRLCGEKLKPRRRILTNQGSPPPMRGKDDAVSPAIKQKRITPAYAGKSRRSLKIRPATWDHPRLCGEKVIRSVGVAQAAGSPPPMRGKGKCNVGVIQYCRITPAYAGKSRNISGIF